MSRATLAYGALLVALVAIAGVYLAVRIIQPPSESPDRVVAGYYEPDDHITVQNLTIADGRYRVGYSMEVLFTPLGASEVLRCELLDTSGRIEFFDAGIREVEAGEWTPIAFSTVLELPEVTLGLRCSPDAEGLVSVVFRSVSLYAVVPGIFDTD
jgi:hypothetical protein